MRLLCIVVFIILVLVALLLLIIIHVIKVNKRKISENQALFDERKIFGLVTINFELKKIKD
jgi:4-hydroxybenzoate polyprenyltransferase